MATLSMDVIGDILLRLPVKALLRFKSVSRSWYELISSPFFIKRQLDWSRATNSNTRFLFRSPYLHTVKFDTLDDVVRLDLSLMDDNHVLAVLGSCDGLFCLCLYDYDITIFLYNPTTRTHMKLPFCQRPSEFPPLNVRYAFGFGHVPNSDDYKFVRMLQCIDTTTGSLLCETMVYSLKSNTWRRIEDCPHSICPGEFVGTPINGAFHWLIEGTQNGFIPKLIATFNLVDDTYGVVPLPKFEEEFILIHIGVLDGCLCLLINYLEHCDIWMMKEHGATESWTVLLRIAKPHIVEPHILEMYEKPIAFSKSRRKLFLQLNLFRTVSYDLEEKVFQNVSISGLQKCYDGEVYVENLLVLKDDNEAIGIGQEHGTHKRRRRRGRGNGRSRMKRRCGLEVLC